MKEIWVQAWGIPRFLVSNYGNVKSKVTGKLIKQAMTHRGYFKVSTTVNNVAYQVHTHRLVLQSFTGENHPDKHAAHLNGIKTDNRISNLKWATPKENNEHRIIHGTNGAGHKNSQARLSVEKVKEIMDIRATGLGRKEIAKKLNLHPETVGSVIFGYTWNVVTGLPIKRKKTLRSRVEG